MHLSVIIPPNFNRLKHLFYFAYDFVSPKFK